MGDLLLLLLLACFNALCSPALSSTSSGDLHLLDIRIRPGACVKDVIDGCWLHLQDGVRKTGGKTLLGFKIIGENRIVSVIEDAADAGAEAVTAAFGDHIELVCTPLRSYAGFAKNVLGVETPETTDPSPPPQLGNDGPLFWLHFDIEYRGLTLQELLSVWKAEAQVALTGNTTLGLFKVVGQRNVELFLEVPSGELLDDIFFTFPMMKDIGDQVHITSKSIRILTPTRHP